MSGDLSETLRGLIRDIGEAGVAKMATDPGLAAEVDQHAAAVRDVITGSGGELHEAALLDYLHGFADTALEQGWWPGEEYDWQLVRVIAVCSLVRGFSAA
ncbi:MAG: hypothetical protein JWN52_62 [Actinomycetia bacterium]|nr:hypothetical protein [Actinomycetes bacterium]